MKKTAPALLTNMSSFENLLTLKKLLISAKLDKSQFKNEIFLFFEISLSFLSASSPLFMFFPNKTKLLSWFLTKVYAALKPMPLVPPVIKIFFFILLIF